jgi:hypothetical protein
MAFPQVTEFSPNTGNCIDIVPHDVVESVCATYGMVDSILLWKELVEYSIYSWNNWYRFYFLTGFEKENWLCKCLLLWEPWVESQAKNIGLAYGMLTNYICEQVFCFILWYEDLSFKNIWDYRIPFFWNSKNN